MFGFDTPFWIFVGIIATAGPGHIEGGFQAIEDKGAKAAIVQAWDEREALDYGSLNN